MRSHVESKCKHKISETKKGRFSCNSDPGSTLTIHVPKGSVRVRGMTSRLSPVQQTAEIKPYRNTADIDVLGFLSRRWNAPISRANDL